MLRLFLVSVLAHDAVGHQWLQSPLPRSGEEPLNGVVFGQTLDGSGDQSRSYVSHLFDHHPAYEQHACGGSNDPRISSAVQGSGTKSQFPEKFDMDLPPSGGRVVERMEAGAEVTLGMKGFFHQGVVRLAVCYENCNARTSFEDYILGYWFMEGTKSPDPDIYEVNVNITATLPDRNCDRCVLQLLFDTEDGRSYVSCSDVELQGAATDDASEEVVAVCNGHPFCDCVPDVTADGNFGLGGNCPYGSTGNWVNDVKAQLGTGEFCNLCVDGGCPSSCGGPWEGFYNGPNCVPQGCPTKHVNDLPRYMGCSGTEGCACPGCDGGVTPRNGNWEPPPGGPAPTVSPPAPSASPPAPTSPPAPVPSDEHRCPPEATQEERACVFEDGKNGLILPPAGVDISEYCFYISNGYYGYIWDATRGSYACSPSARSSSNGVDNFCIYDDSSLPTGVQPQCQNINQERRFGYSW